MILMHSAIVISSCVLSFELLRASWFQAWKMLIMRWYMSSHDDEKYNKGYSWEINIVSSVQIGDHMSSLFYKLLQPSLVSFHFPLHFPLLMCGSGCKG